MSIALRMQHIAPFHVMELMQRAQTLEAAGRHIIHMEVGEPDFPTPAPIVDAAQHFIAEGKVFYTSALGLPALRQAIAQDYQKRFGVTVPMERIVITAGASAALLMTMGALVDSGDEILVADPGYPCNRHFISLYGGVPRAICVGAEQNYQPTVQQIAQHWQTNTKGVLLASPSNPTGTLISSSDLQTIHAEIRRRNGVLIVDEIYQGLTYDQSPSTALSLGEDVFVINSFSKYFGMTGWRLGWMVVPEAYGREIEKLAQNLYISPSAPAQYAALAAFLPETMEILEDRRRAFQARRDFLLSKLPSLGIRIAAKPEGAFYIYGDVSALTNDSFRWTLEVLEQAGVAITPGLDFGMNQPERYVRFAYTVALNRLEEGIARLQTYIDGR
jgi:aspartate/methionine/tyrosine aminotransferase